MEQPLAIPLVFSFKHVVMGDGFVAGVRMDGRALLEVEHNGGDREDWVTGIAPVGISGGGRDRSAAFFAFRNAWTEVIFDIAHEASSFSSFRESCNEFFGAEQASMTALWEAAVETVRREKYVDPSLLREDADQHRVRFEVVDLTDFEAGADANVVETGVQAAA